MSSCCCTDEGDGHRCPEAWHWMLLAQHARKRGGSKALRDTARAAYTLHRFAATRITAGVTAWPDVSGVQLTDDPRCARCKETP